MEPRSLGYRTDLIFHRWKGSVQDHGDFLAIRTPSNPGHFFGNFLLFAGPPRAGDLQRWEGLFAREIGMPPEVRHVAFGWDGVDGALGEIEPFRARGYQLEQSVVLAAESVREPPKVSREVEVRPVRTDAEWREVLEVQVLCRDSQYALESYSRFKSAQLRDYRRLIAEGIGQWMGAFQDGRLVANLGIFVEHGIGRFQTVATHPEFRRRGICGRLVLEAARAALSRMGARRLVMVADESYFAARIYESVGFRPVERNAAVFLFDPS